MAALQPSLRWPIGHAVVLPASSGDTDQFGIGVDRHDDSPLLGHDDPEPPDGLGGAITRRDDDVRAPGRRGRERGEGKGWHPDPDPSWLLHHHGSREEPDALHVESDLEIGAVEPPAVQGDNLPGRPP
jgi:hypothetical protein